MRSEAEVNQAIEKYANMVKRLCLIHLKQEADTEDIFQTVFLNYALSSVSFQTPEHEKAWLIRVTLNACKDLLKSFFRTHTVPLQAVAELAGPDDGMGHSHVLEAVLKLPEKYRKVIYLHYYEGYTAPQIGEILHKNVNSIYTLLTRARRLLREELGGEEHG